MYKEPPPKPTASAIGPCPTLIQTVGRPGSGSLPRTIAPPDHILKEGIVMHLTDLLFYLQRDGDSIEITGKLDEFILALIV